MLIYFDLWVEQYSIEKYDEYGYHDSHGHHDLPQDQKQKVDYDEYGHHDHKDHNQHEEHDEYGHVIHCNACFVILSVTQGSSYKDYNWSESITNQLWFGICRFWIHLDTLLQVFNFYWKEG